MQAPDKLDALHQWILWLSWIVLNSIGWSIGALFANMVVTTVLGGGSFAAAVLGGGIVGLVLGSLQWLLVRQLARNSGWWVLATALGMAIGSPLGTLTMTILMQMNHPILAVPSGSAAIAMVFGFAQSLVLRKHFNKASMWIIVSILAIVASTLSELVIPSGPLSMYFVDGMVFGAVTGVGLLWLSRQYRRIPQQATL